MNLLLDILICNYNRSIAKLIDTIPNEDWLKVIYYDDGSTKNVSENIDLIKNKYRNYTYLCSSTNRGILQARSSALRNVSAKFFTFVDSDDWFCVDWNELFTRLSMLENDSIIHEFPTLLHVGYNTRKYFNQGDYLANPSFSGKIIPNKFSKITPRVEYMQYADELALQCEIYLMHPNGINRWDTPLIEGEVTSDGITNQMYHNEGSNHLALIDLIELFKSYANDNMISSADKYTILSRINLSIQEVIDCFVRTNNLPKFNGSTKYDIVTGKEAETPYI